MLLVMPVVEAANRSQRAVVFQPEGDLLCCVKTDFSAGRKFETGICVRAVQRFFEGGIKGKIPPMPLLIDDGTDFPSPGILGKGAALISDLGRKAYTDRQSPFVGRANTGTNMIAHPLPAMVGLNAGKHIQPGLEPRGEPVRNLESFVEGMLGREHAVYGTFLAFNGVITMELNHGSPLRHGFGAIDLNLVIVLSLHAVANEPHRR